MLLSLLISSVIINEIAWMGTITSANDEWIELYNNNNYSVNLDGWVLKAGDGAPEIKLSGVILAESFYLLERTDDNTVAGILADKIYTGALENSGEDLKLYDNLNNLVDEINCQDGWFAGDNATKQTIETLRQAQGENRGWQNSKEPGGTPKTKNSQIETRSLLLKEEPIEIGSLTSYPAGIVFNEILPSPEGPDETEEWIEIFNQNDFEVELASWQIKDKEGKITIYTFPEEIKITALGYLVLKRPETKITLNNSGDGLELIQPNGNVLDSINFGKAPQSQSYSKTPSGWDWNNILTPGAKNITSSPQSKQEPTPTAQFVEKQEANITLSPKDSNYPVILIALIVAVFSTGAVLVLKKYINPVRG